MLIETTVTTYFITINLCQLTQVRQTSHKIWVSTNGYQYDNKGHTKYGFVSPDTGVTNVTKFRYQPTDTGMTTKATKYGVIRHSRCLNEK